MNEECFGNNGEKDSVRKAIGEDSADLSFAAQDAIQLRIIRRPADGLQHFVDQLLSESGSVRSYQIAAATTSSTASNRKMTC
jgi:hypothetical protein